MKLSRVATLPSHFLPKKALMSIIQDLLVGVVWGGARKLLGVAIQTPGNSILVENFLI